MLASNPIHWALWAQNALKKQQEETCGLHLQLQFASTDILVPVEANGVGSRSSTMLYSITESTEVQPRRRRWITAAPSLTNADEPVFSHPIKHCFRFLSAWAKVLPSYPACKIPGGTWQRKWKQIICPRLQTEFCICSFGHDERHHLYALY